MTRESSPSKEESALVQSLTAKLEELRSEKGELERQLEAESENITLKLQWQLSALLEQQQQASDSPSSSFPVSPSDFSTLPSPRHSVSLEPAEVAPGAIITTLQSLQTENSELRQQLEKTQSVSEERRRELVELRSRCGIPVDGLSNEGGRASRTSAQQWVGGSPRTSSITIPGSSTSVSPSSSFFNHARRRSTAGSSFASTSSQKTSLTTPSTSYPLTTAPYPTPSSSSPTSYTSPVFRNLPFSVPPSPPPPSLVSSSFRGPAALDDEDLRADFENGPTPSSSPGSRSGGLIRRGSMGGRANVAEQGTLRRARGASRAGERPEFVDEKGAVEEEAVGELEGV